MASSSRLSSRQRLWLQRGVAVLLTVLVVPAVVALGSLAEDAPIVAGQEAPRSVRADELIRIQDEEATEEARRAAANAVEPIYVLDTTAQGETIRAVQEAFEAFAEARAPAPVPPPSPAPGDQATSEPVPRQTVPPEAEQLAFLRDALPYLSDEALLAGISLTDAQLDRLETETVEAARQLARLRIQEDELESTLDERLPSELSLRNFPADTGSMIAEPVIRNAIQPTVRINNDATEQAREEAAAEVAPVVQTWQEGEVVVREGEQVTEIQMQALRQLGLEGTDPRVAFGRAAAAMLVIVLVIAFYLQRMQPRVWASGRKALLLASLTTGYAAIVTAVGLLVDVAGAGWWYVAPAAALAMLAAIMIHPVVGIATMLPGVAIVQLASPQTAAAALFAAGSVLVAVPFVTELSSRAELRSATLRMTAVLPALAFTTVAVFGPREELLVAVAAGIVSGILTAMLVQGLLPFLENSFRLPTVTALLDLADRNHPLLRELEQKALGSYNHSVMVASLVERSCREIGANALLGSVASLYHDIGKVRQPHYFIENQQGIRNPHDDLEPEVSAIIIQNHVIDGVEMAREHRLPPEVVACIGSHHGTMLVTYFYRKALDRAGGDLEKVDVDHYRYKGTKPRSKEAAVLLMADCCEAATRSAAMERGTLSRDRIESMVDHLIQERVDDGQFDRCDLTFAEMTRVRNSIVEALVGIYHPRIAYPGQEGGPQTGEIPIPQVPQSVR